MTLPELTLVPPFAEPEAEKKREAAPAQPAVLDESSLSPAEQQAVVEFAEKIDITNTNMVLQYGSRRAEENC